MKGNSQKTDIQTQASKQSTSSSPGTVAFLVNAVSQFTSVLMFMNEWGPYSHCKYQAYKHCNQFSIERPVWLQVLVAYP